MCKTTQKLRQVPTACFKVEAGLLTEVKGEDPLSPRPRHPSAGSLAFYSVSMIDSLQGKDRELVHLPVSAVSAALTS